MCPEMKNKIFPLIETHKYKKRMPEISASFFIENICLRNMLFLIDKCYFDTASFAALNSETETGPLTGV